MNNWKIILLRMFLAITTAGSSMLLYLCWFTPEMAISIYGGTELDNIHRMLFVLFGAAIAGYIIATLLALWKPQEYRQLLLIVAIFHAIITLADYILYVNNIASQATLLSQMIYDLIITAALFGLYPSTASDHES